MAKVAPLQTYLHECFLDQAWTDDALKLNYEHSMVPVFMYGTEKVGFSEDLTKRIECVHIGSGYTVTNGYVCYIHQQDRFPVAFQTQVHSKRGRLWGQIFLMQPDALFEIDCKYANGEHFQRGERWIKWMATQQIRETTSQTWFQSRAYMYFGVWGKWQLDALRMMPLTVPRSPDVIPYYLFGKAEDQAANNGG